MESEKGKVKDEEFHTEEHGEGFAFMSLFVFYTKLISYIYTLCAIPHANFEDILV